MSYTCKSVSFLHPIRLLATAKILYLCGKDMARKYDLHHWDNSMLKTTAVVCYGLLKNKTFLVYDEKAIATFQVKKNGDCLHFGKLATLPECSGKGIGSWCMSNIEQMAKDQGCSSISMEVYDKSNHAKEFYLHRGYVLCGEVKTRKYTEFKMRKDLNI